VHTEFIVNHITNTLYFIIHFLPLEAEQLSDHATFTTGFQQAKAHFLIKERNSKITFFIFKRRFSDERVSSEKKKVRSPQRRQALLITGL
jgi:hypothetical protein